MYSYEQFVELLRSEVKPALGCTEPMAIALAVARSCENIRPFGEEITSVRVEVSRNILKNAMGVGIPGTNMVGIPVAIAIAMVCGDSTLGLEVLQGVCPNVVEDAKAVLDRHIIDIKLADTEKLLYISAECCTANHSVKTTIEDMHDNITRCEIDGNVEIIGGSVCSECSLETNATIYPSVREIYDFVVAVPVEKIAFMLDAAKLNRAIAHEGLKSEYGLQVGRTIYENMGGDVFGTGLLAHAMAITAAASDARMAGSMMAVMSNSGSGNQGITATLPVVAAAEKYSSSEEELIRALALSHLVAIHIKQSLGRLSALCGCVVASTGSSCGIVLLRGGNFDQIASAIKNMIGNITGMVCDGAKVGCALKVASGVSASVQSAILALNGISTTHNDGIIDDCLEQTLKNLSTIGCEGMKFTDRIMLDIMSQKKC